MLINYENNKQIWIHTRPDLARSILTTLTTWQKSLFSITFIPLIPNKHTSIFIKVPNFSYWYGLFRIVLCLLILLVLRTIVNNIFHKFLNYHHCFSAIFFSIEFVCIFGLVRLLIKLPFVRLFGRVEYEPPSWETLTFMFSNTLFFAKICKYVHSY